MMPTASSCEKVVYTEDAYSKVVVVVTVADVIGSSDLIFVTNITNIISGEKIVM